MLIRNYGYVSRKTIRTLNPRQNYEQSAIIINRLIIIIVHLLQLRSAVNFR